MALITQSVCLSRLRNGTSKELLDIVRDANRKLAERHQGYTAEISLTKACYFGKSRRGNVLIGLYFFNSPLA